MLSLILRTFTGMNRTKLKTLSLYVHAPRTEGVRVGSGAEGRWTEVRVGRRKPTFAKRTHTPLTGLIRVSPLPPSSALRFTSQRCRTRPYRPRTRSATAPCLCRTGAAPATSGLCVNSASPYPVASAAAAAAAAIKAPAARTRRRRARRRRPSRAARARRSGRAGRGGRPRARASSRRSAPAPPRRAGARAHR